MKRIAVVAAILENTTTARTRFNEVVFQHKKIIRGRMGLPFEEDEMAVVSLTVVGSLDEINALTGRLGNLEDVTVKTAISEKSIREG